MRFSDANPHFRASDSNLKKNVEVNLGILSSQMCPYDFHSDTWTTGIRLPKEAIACKVNITTSNSVIKFKLVPSEERCDGER